MSEDCPFRQKAISLISFTYKTFGSSNSCWPYQGSGRGKGGYGRITVRIAGETKTFAAHRLSYEHQNKRIVKGFLIRHSCNNPICINPNHLEIGTAQDNSDDMVSAGRSLDQKGEKNHNSKLTDEQRSEIVRHWRGGMTYADIGRMYAVHLSTVAYICKTHQTKK